MTDIGDKGTWDKGTGTLSLLNLKTSILHLHSNPTPSNNKKVIEGMC